MVYRRHELNISLSDEDFNRLKEVSAKMGYRNEGHTIALAVHFLELSIKANSENLEIGVFDPSKNTFLEWCLPKVKVLKKGEDDFFIDKILNCAGCGKDFILIEGDKVREENGHEGMHFVDCPECSWSNSF